MSSLKNNPSRRHVLGVLGAFAVSPAFSGAAWALNEKSAEALVTKLVDDINGIIGSGKSEAGMLKDFERVFEKYADVPTIARYALGVEARSATPKQLRSFTDAFSVYVSRKYGRRFREFIGGRIEVRDTRKVKSFYEVRTTAFLKGESPFAMTFLVSDRSGKDLFFNMFIEGINMLLTERTEIGAMLDRRKGDLDALARDLRDT
ncbi:MAG: ABC transporter substrate-binding protein [Pseudomonadota bacterium]